MPSNDPVQRFHDILTNIVRIEKHVAGILDMTAFEENYTAHDAVERCMERISEGASKLAGLAEELCPDIPWSKIRGLGNVLRHEYDRVQSVRIWYVVQDDLPRLKMAVEAALRKLQKDT